MLVPEWLPHAIGLVILAIAGLPLLRSGLRTWQERKHIRPLKWPLSPQQTPFHQAEFAALKAEVAEAVKNTATNFQYAVLGSVGVFTWIVTETAKNDFKGAYLRTGLWFPFILSCFLASLSAAQYLRIGQIAAYLERIENALGSSELGWEKVFKRRARTVGGIYLLGWIILLAANSAIGALGPHILKLSACLPVGIEAAP